MSIKEVGVLAASGFAIATGAIAYLFSKLQEQQRQLEFIEQRARETGEYQEDDPEVLNYPRSRHAVPLPLPLRETTDNPELSCEAMTNKLTLDDVDCAGKRVLMRVDFNCESKAGHVLDDSRIKISINTIKYVLAKKAQCVVLIAHLGRPGGDYDRKTFTLFPVVEVLSRYLPGTKVHFLDDCIGPKIEEAIENAEAGTVFMCENLRFHIEETGSGIHQDGQQIIASPEDVTKFREGLSRLGDIFVFEAFGAAHRNHSSVIGISIPQRVAGLSMQREINVYAEVLSRPERPFLAIIGGSKVSDKIDVIENLFNLVDEIIIGGGMAYTFKKTLEGVDIGGSLFDKEGAMRVAKLIKKAQDNGVTVHLPVDHIIADNFSAEATIGITDDSKGIPDGWMALDAGPRSKETFSKVIARAKTVLWNGPLGVHELGPFASGTLSVMNDLVTATNAGAVTVIGGGGTGAASHRMYVGRGPVATQVTHVSSGGGSSLVLMEGKMLPGVQALADR